MCCDKRSHAMRGVQFIYMGRRIRKALGTNLRNEISADKNGRYAGAIGAALAARNM